MPGIQSVQLIASTVSTKQSSQCCRGAVPRCYTTPGKVAFPGLSVGLISKRDSGTDGAQSGEDDVFGLEVEHPVRGSGRSGLRLEGDASSGCGWRTFVNRKSQKPQNEIVIFSPSHSLSAAAGPRSGSRTPSDLTTQGGHTNTISHGGYCRGLTSTGSTRKQASGRGTNVHYQFCFMALSDARTRREGTRSSLVQREHKSGSALLPEALTKEDRTCPALAEINYRPFLWMSQLLPRAGAGLLPEAAP